MKKASVIIPNYNGASTLGNCLTSVLTNDYPDFEVVVVDDQSTDQSLKIIQNINDHRLRLICNERNSGAAFSRNRGIRNANGDIIILLDSDSYVERDWIGKHVQLSSTIDADIIGGGMVGIHQSIAGACDGFCTWYTSIPFSKDFYLKKLHLPTNNMSLRKNVFKEIGNFNEQIIKVGGEDAEFCHRALQKGLKIYFKSDLVAYHYDRNDFKEYLKHQENWGKFAVKMRKTQKMDYHYLLPNTYGMAHLYILPLAILYTGYIVCRWLPYRPSILIYSPIIFLGKLKQTIAIKNSFK